MPLNHVLHTSKHGLGREGIFDLEAICPKKRSSMKPETIREQFILAVLKLKAKEPEDYLQEITNSCQN